MISILNYGMGNIASIQNMFKKVGVSGRVIATVRELNEARALVIPGVGKFDNAMRQIEWMGLCGARSSTLGCPQWPHIGGG